MTVFIDPDLPTDELQQKLYDGNLVVLTPCRRAADFVAYTRDQLEQLFAPHGPEQAAHLPGAKGQLDELRAAQLQPAGTE